MIERMRLAGKRALSRYVNNSGLIALFARQTMARALVAGLFLLLGAASAHAVTVTNTAQMTYTGINAPMTASVDFYANVVTTPNQATVSLVANPDVIVAGGSTTLSLNFANTGSNALNNAVMTVTPPAGSTLTVPADPYGRYTVTTLPNGDIQVALTGPLPTGQSMNIASTLDIPASAPAGPISIGASVVANNLPIIQGSTTAHVIRTRTPAVITFMQLDPVTGQLIPADVYHAGQNVWIQVEDGDQNMDPYTVETVSITLTTPAGDTNDSETMTLVETGPNTGVFTVMIPSQGGAVGTAAIQNDGIIEVADGTQMSALYTDRFDNTDTTAAAALVDPFGVIFDAYTGTPINGVVITIWDLNTNAPAAVFGDDGVSAYPATVTTGGTVTDASGKVYQLKPGNYRFPYVQPSNYQFRISPIGGYAFPSGVPTAQLQLLAGAPYAITVGSRGEAFIINPGPALHIDIPMDPKLTSLFLQKSASKSLVAIGDGVGYSISIENPNPLADVTLTTVNDTLPVGLRYVSGSAVLDGYSLADPIIASNGRDLAFNVGTIPAGKVRSLSYLVRVGSNATLGEAINVVRATGTQLATIVNSNIAKASIQIQEDLIRSKSFIMGRVFVDSGKLGGDAVAAATTTATGGSSAMAGAIDAAKAKDNQLSDDGEEGLAGVRIYMEDGSFVVTDKDGFYHFKAIEPGTHIMQLDVDSLPEQYEVVGMDNTRFAGRTFSQFVDVQGGGVWRSNFRVRQRPEPEMPVTVIHQLHQEADGQWWATVEVQHQKSVPLRDLNLFYNAPKGWKVLTQTATLDGVATLPQNTMFGSFWKLDETLATQTLRVQLQSGGDGGDKKASAYARFVSQGTPKGRTGLAVVTLKDTVTETSIPKKITLNLHFATRKAELPAADLPQVQSLVHSLDGLTVHHIRVEGHTDNIRIAPRNRKEFADNQALSEARAQSLANYLMQQLKLSSDQVQAVGMGSVKPIASNQTKEGRAKNRRVEVYVDAARVSRTWSNELKEERGVAQGKAVGSWDKQGWASSAQQTQAPLEHKTDDGFLKPVDGSALINPVNEVRVQLPANLTMALLLDGKQIPADRIGFKAMDKKTGKKVYGFIGVDFGEPGKHELTLQGKDPFGNTRFDKTITVTRTGEIARIELLDQGENVADGVTPVKFRVRLQDENGEVIRGNSELEFRGGDLSPHGTKTGDAQLSDRDAAKSAKEASTIRVARDGTITMAPTTVSGMHTVTVGYNNAQQTLHVLVKAPKREWIMVGLGEGTVGYNKLSGAMQPITNQSQNDKFYRDGRLAFYAKGMVKGDFLLTMAYDTAKTQGKVGNSLNQTVDPNSYYTIYGDMTSQQYDASSQRKLYLKLEKNAFYALFGDFNTGLSVTELTRYSRQLNGVKSEYHGETLGYNAFVTQTSQSLRKDEIRGDGTSGLYRLSRSTITANSETIFIETRDRFRSEVILQSRQLTRHVDYDIDYQAGTLYFKQPVESKDTDLNPVYIRVEYESKDTTDQFTTFGGRGSVKALDDKLELGMTYVQEGKLGKDDTITGVDATVDLTDQIRLKAEAAKSRNQLASSGAYKAEVSHLGKTVNGSAYVRQVGKAFGLGQVLGSEDATRKFGGRSDIRVTDNVKLQLDAFRQMNLNTKAKRDNASTQLSYNLKDSVSVRGGVRGVRDIDGAGNKRTSKQLTTGATAKISSRLSARVDREQSLGKGNSTDFPTRSTVGLDYLLTDSTTVSATQEWTQGQSQSSQSTRVGVKTKPWSGAQLSTGYQQQLNESGISSMANVGLQQQYKYSDTLTFSAGMDRTHTLKHPGATPLNLNVPLASGGGSDFTAWNIGMNYAPEGWVWDNRFEYRMAALSRKWNLSTGIQGEPVDDLATQMNFQLNVDRQAAGTATNQGMFSMGMAYRPLSDGLILLNRFDVKYANNIALASNSTSWRYVNNLTANWQTRADVQLGFNYGAKLARELFNGNGLNTFTQLGGMQGVWDFADGWDMSFQLSALHAVSMRQYSPSFGLGLGHNLFDNLWVTLGYNFTGFYDPDFRGAEFTRQGPYMKFRFKFDQNSLNTVLTQDAQN